MATPLPKFQQKYEREKEKVRERKFGISAMALPKFLLPKKLTETNCGNGIAEIGKKNFVTIVTMPLPKMGGEKNVVIGLWQWHCRNRGKKICGNCGNAIAENGRGKKKVVAEI